MISVRKQEFIEMFLLGVVHLVIGISGYIVKSNMINLIAFVVTTSYSIFIYTKRKFKKQQDDDDSLQNKNKAGHVTFLIFIAILTLFLGIMVLYGAFNGKGFYTTITLDLNFICIILGSLEIIYYLVFMYFDRSE